MKRVFVLIITMVLLLLLSFSVCAKEVFSLSADTDEVKVNRYFEVVLVTSEGRNVSGGKITLNFDADVLEYVKFESENFTIESKEADGAVTIVFVADVDTNESAVIFRAKFKALSASQTKIGINDAQYVDKSLVIHDMKSADCVVNIVSTNISTQSGVKGESNKLKNKSEKAPSYSEDKDKANEETIWLGTADSKHKVILYCVLFVIFIAFVFVLGVFFNKNNAKKKRGESIEEIEQLVE